MVATLEREEVQTNTLVPQYCGTCGTHLVEDRFDSVAGFDIYTGAPVTNSYVTRRCPNPTVTTSAFGRTSKTNHPSYQPREDGSWVQL